MDARGVRRFYRRWIPAFALLSLGWAGASPGSAAPYTPPIWRESVVLADGTEIKGKMVGWNRDENRNFVDDVIDQRIADGAASFDLVVAFNRCVTCCPTGEDEVVQLLRKMGTLDYLGKYLTFAVVLDVAAEDVFALAGREEVAMVEILDPDTATLDNSVAAVRVRSSTTFSPNTVQDWNGTITGTGGSIGILDSGVDDAGGPGTTHAMFPTGTFLGGANCLTDPCTIGDPDDDNGHGTHVAGIALGRLTNCGGTTTCRGVAPGARLVDIKILNNLGSSVGASVLRGIELAIAQRAAWNLRVINLSVGNCLASNGVNTTAQLLNTAVMHGLVVVVAAGNTGNCGLPNNANLINHVASASLAITVGSVDDGNTVPLGNDSLSTFSLIGPRLSDNDGDPLDERKPEIVAPGTAIRSASFNTTNSFVAFNGTSMAAPHVAGAVALLLQASPAMAPGSVKEVLIQRAAQSNKPGAHPGWNTGWGYGFLDVFAALTRTLVTDVGRPTEPPYAACASSWCSPHISTASAPRINQANTITAQVRNFGGVAASNVKVCFGVYVFSNNNNRFHELGCQQVNLPAASTVNVSLPWTPSSALIPPGFPAGQAIHSCLKVSIDYAFDTVLTNNDMQRNTSIATASIARAPLRIENNTTGPLNVRLIATNSNPNWTVRVLEKGTPLSELKFALGPEDCPRDLIVELEPKAGTPVGDKATVVVQAVDDFGKDLGGIVIEGVHLNHSLPGTIKGQVTLFGEGLPGVVVTATDASGGKRVTVTSASGDYGFSVAEGTYSVAVQLEGCTTQIRTGVTVDPGLASQVDLALSCTAEAKAVAPGADLQIAP